MPYLHWYLVTFNLWSKCLVDEEKNPWESSMKMAWKMGSRAKMFFELFVLKSHYSKWLVTGHMSANHHGEQWIEKADPRRSSQRSAEGRRRNFMTWYLTTTKNYYMGLWFPKSEKKLRTGPKKSWPFRFKTQIAQELPRFLRTYITRAWVYKMQNLVWCCLHFETLIEKFESCDNTCEMERFWRDWNHLLSWSFKWKGAQWLSFLSGMRTALPDVRWNQLKPGFVGMVNFCTWLLCIARST